MVVIGRHNRIFNSGQFYLSFSYACSSSSSSIGQHRLKVKSPLNVFVMRSSSVIYLIPYVSTSCYPATWSLGDGAGVNRSRLSPCLLLCSPITTRYPTWTRPSAASRSPSPCSWSRRTPLRVEAGWGCGAGATTSPAPIPCRAMTSCLHHLPLSPETVSLSLHLTVCLSSLQICLKTFESTANWLPTDDWIPSNFCTCLENFAIKDLCDH